MHLNVGKLPPLIATILLICSLASAVPAAADTNQCAPSGKDGAIALPKKLATANRPARRQVHDRRRRAAQLGGHRRAGTAHAPNPDRRTLSQARQPAA